MLIFNLNYVKQPLFQSIKNTIKETSLEKKTFQLLPRRFVINLLKIQGNNMFSEANFSQTEKEVLDDFTEKKYVKSTKIAGKIVYFDLNSEIKKYLISMLKIQK